ncbi:MAG TPA: pilus assembly protein TadG-related protein [Pirellulaceae bacterium]
MDFCRRRGSINLATVFALLLLAFLLGMVLNVARQVDNKIKLQNAADAATYSGGIVLARGMNSVAFSNHLLCEVFAMTAIMREARDRHGEPLVPEILNAWNQIAPKLSRAPSLPDWPYPKFSAAGNAIPQKTPLEQTMVTKYGEWMAASSELVLPLLEQILQQELIPQFQREVIQATPQMAQIATARIAEQHTGRPLPWDQSRPPIEAILWRSIIDPVGGGTESAQGTLPAIGPDNPQYDLNSALAARNNYARNYLNLWNYSLMQRFDDQNQGVARMSAFGGLWRGFTCAQLQQLISEYPNSNLPQLIREAPPTVASVQKDWLTNNYQFVGVVYRRKVAAAVPKVFSDTLTADNQTFAQGMLFVPRSRPVDVGWWLVKGEWQWGFIHGELWNQQRWGAPRQVWDLWNQGWTFQLVPAVSPAVPSILMQPPQSPYISAAVNSQQQPHLNDMSVTDVIRLTTH